MRAVVILLAAAVATGCASATTAGRVAQTLESAMPECRFEPDSTMVLGKVSLGLIRSLSHVAGDDLDEDTAEILHSIRRIEVASYRATRECVLAESSPSLSRRLAGDGWRATVTTAEESGEHAWVFSREGDDGGVTGMLVIALDQGELEVVRLDGDIDRLLTAAIADNPSTALGLANDK